MVWIVVFTVEEPHPARTGTGTTIHLLLIHPLSIDVQVSVTISVRIHGFDGFTRQLIVTIFHQVAATIQELQQIGTTVIVELHAVVHFVGNIDVEVLACTSIAILVRIVFNLSNSISH